MNSDTLRDGFTLMMLALREDFGVDEAPWITGDVTAMACINEDATGRARIEARQQGILCGLPLVEAVFREVAGDLPLACVTTHRDGDKVEAGDAIMTISGNLRALLGAERTALNFLQRMAGIATKTGRLVSRLENGTRLLDTRKTTPGWRRLEKYAVATGGGMNHRMGLHDMVLIKENHIRGAGSIGEAVKRARRYCTERTPRPRIEVEVTSLAELSEALDAGADVVMLDNFSPALAREAVTIAAGRVMLEISGGITEENLSQVAALGVDWISSGALTHSATAFDCSLLVEEAGQ